MRASIAIGVGGLIAVAAIAAWLAPVIEAEERTDVGIELVDARDRRIERAELTFLDRNEREVAAVDLVGGQVSFRTPEPEDPEWGQPVSAVRVRAFGCDRRAPVAVGTHTSGARLGRFSPHPVPLTRTYRLVADVRCPAPDSGIEAGLPLDRLVGELGRAEPWSYAAARELVRIGPAAAPALDDVATIAERAAHDGLRVLLIRAIGEMGPAGRPAAPTLFGFLDAARLEASDPALRRVAASALEQLGPETPALVARLSQAARADPDRRVQEHTLRILGRMGRAARSAEADLVAVLEDPAEEDGVRLAAFWALGRIGTDGATAARRRHAATHAILWSDPSASAHREGDVSH